MDFREMLRIDNRETFLNLEEFGECHNVGGRSMTILIDDNEMIEREKRESGAYRQGVFRKVILFYVSASEFGSLPPVGRSLMLDGNTYIITDAIDEEGIYSISLEAKRACER